MTRYFFDIKCGESIEFDYKGRVLPSLEHAKQMAELIAMDVGCTRPTFHPSPKCKSEAPSGPCLPPCLWVQSRRWRLSEKLASIPDVLAQYRAGQPDCSVA